MAGEFALILLLGLVELALGLAAWLSTREKRLRAEGIPTVQTSPHHAWFLLVVLPSTLAAYHFIRQSDWLSLGMLGLSMVSVGLAFHMHARRVVVGSVPVARVTEWARAWATSRGLSDDAWKVHDRWEENRSVAVELPSAGRAALMDLAQALRPLVAKFPSPGPWRDVSLPLRIAPGFLLLCMVLIPLAAWLSRIG